MTAPFYVTTNLFVLRTSSDVFPVSTWKLPEGANDVETDGTPIRWGPVEADGKMRSERISP